MFRRRYSFKKRGRYGRKGYRKYKSQYGFFRRGGQYRRLYKSFRRYKKFKRSGFRFAQRKYQITKYRLPNVVNPDELIMTFKHNFVYMFDVTEPGVTRITFPCFGMDASVKGQITGFQENLDKYLMIEFLSGNAQVYVFNQSQVLRRVDDSGPPATTQSVDIKPYLMVGTYVTRTCVDQAGLVKEEPPPLISGTAEDNDLWKKLAEYPGYSCKFIGPAYSSKCTQKFKFAMSQRSFKKLRADPVGFTVATEKIDGANTFPNNISTVHFDMQTLQRTGPPPSNNIFKRSAMIMVSYKFKVRFKQRKMVTPK